MCSPLIVWICSFVDKLLCAFCLVVHVNAEKAHTAQTLKQVSML